MSDELKPDEPVAETEESVITDHQAQMAMDALRSEQNLTVGIIAGLIASLIGAGIWAGVTIATEYQIGWMSIGVGFLVGLAVRVAGKGLDQIFGIVGGVMSFIGCGLGNVVTISYFVALNEGMELMDFLSQLDLAITIEMLTSTFEIMDILFYGLAVYVGYRYAFREITQKDFDRALGKAI